MEEALALKDKLLDLLDEDPPNSQRILARLDGICSESGVSAHSALLMILTDLAFEEEEARRHWEALLDHHARLSQALGRDLGLRVSVFDYFMNVNRRLTAPKIIDLEIYESENADAISDRETGLANQRYFRLALQTELRRARRYGLGFSVGRVSLDDADEFRSKRGRILADIVARETAILIRNRIRDIDLAALWTSATYAILFPETDRTGAYAVLERIRREVERHFGAKLVEGRPLGLTVSGGLAKYPEDGATAEELIARTEEALYQARARGRNSTCAYFRERRHFLRFDLQRRGLTLRVASLASGSASIAGPRGNISRSGLLFESPEPLQVASTLELTFHDPDAISPLIVRGRVVRLEELSDEGQPGRWDVGIVFLFEYEHEEQDFARFFERFDPTLAPRERT